VAIPTRQLLSQTSYDTDGVTTVWNFSFSDGYLDRDYVKVQLLDKATGVVTQHPITEANFLGDFQLTLTPAFPTGSELTIYRDTPKDAPLVNFADTASLTEISLDTNARQAVHIAAESNDGLATAVDSVSEIANFVQNASDFADAAEASAIAADASATAATTNGAAQVALAAAQVTLATTQANNAAASATAANDSAIAADASADAAAASAASIAGGPVASWVGLTDIITQGEAIAAIGADMPVSTAQSAAILTLQNLYPMTGVRFNFVSTTQCNLVPYGGWGAGFLWINGTNRQITTAVQLSNSGLAANTLYNVYAYWTGSAVATEASTTGFTFNANGIPQKTGDVTRTLVGRVQTNPSTQFADNPASRITLSYFNRLPIELNSGQPGNLTTGSTVMVSVIPTADFLVWGDTSFWASATFILSNDTAGAVTFSNLAVDALTTELFTRGYMHVNSAGGFGTGIATGPMALTSGKHTLIGEISVNSGTATCYGGSSMRALLEH
jgi:hypothetical protein